MPAGRAFAANRLGLLGLWVFALMCYFHSRHYTGEFPSRARNDYKMRGLQMNIENANKVGQLTVLTSEWPSTLGKIYQLEGGKLTKTTAGEMASGSYQVRQFDSVDAFVKLLLIVKTNQAITASTPKAGEPEGRIVTKDNAKSQPGALSRTKDCLELKARTPGVVILDYDPPDGGPVLGQSELWTVVQCAVPEVVHAGVVWWCSSSSYIYHGETGEKYQGLRGQRLYLMVADVSDCARFGETLHRKLWLAGHGRIAISKSGQRLERGVFDVAMFEPARLDFAGGAECRPPLVQRRERPVVLSAGGFLDSRSALPTLSDADQAKYESMLARAKEKALPEAREVHAKWKAERRGSFVERLVAGGMEREKAEKRAEATLDAAFGCCLVGNFMLTLEGGEEVTVKEVLDNPERYHGLLTLDPLEPEYLNRKVVGKLYLRGANPTLFSFAHGGITYRLQRGTVRMRVKPGGSAFLVGEILGFLGREPDVFIYGGQFCQVVSGKIRRLSRWGMMYLVSSRISFFKTMAALV
jgi:hypothetical protein